MNSQTTIKIIDYDDKYETETVHMWRASMERALDVKDKHPIAEQIAYLKNVVVRENKTYLIIDQAINQVVGMMAINGSEINQLYIQVDYQDRGLGSRLLNLAKRLSPDKLQLYTFEINKKAQVFYEKHGFTIIKCGFEKTWNLADIRYEWQPEQITR